MRIRVGGADRSLGRGIALPFVLLIIALMMVTVATMSRQGIGSLSQAKGDQLSKQAFFAAEAGASDALRHLVEDPTYASSSSNLSLPSGGEYSYTVLNNITPGAGTLTAANGALVPEGFAYILASGTVGYTERRVGILVSPGSSTAFGMAIGVGGGVTMQGSKRVSGSIKANGDIRLQGSTSITPSSGSGRLLSSADIRTQGSARVDDSQDVRARGSVSSTPGIRGALIVQSSDTTDSTLPFIADGRTTNALGAGERGLVLPNPDRTLLLPADLSTNPNYVDHSGVTSWSGPLNLNNQIHYFPDGISFSGSTTITGPGTIVVDNGNPMVFQGSTNVEANLIALSPTPAGSGDDPSIRFQGSSTVRGLIYAHEDIRVQGSFRLDGVVIAYRDGDGDLYTQGSTRIQLDSSVMAGIPGFGPWASGFGGLGGIPAGSGPVSVVSWERL